MPLHAEHPLRHTLNNEVHARPPVPVSSPQQVVYLAFLHDNGSAAREIPHLEELAGQLGVPLPSTDSGHVTIAAGALRMKWERHNEFSSYTFFSEDNGGERLLHTLSADWRKRIPGQLLVATEIEVEAYDPARLEQLLARHSPTGPQLVVSQLADGAGWVVTDFRIEDGFSRFLLLDEHLTPRQTGRTVQRLVEIETYRMMALLAFPVAKEVGRLVSRAEDDLADLMDSIGQAETPEDERVVLARLTRLAAEVERSVARTTFRFGAAAAYHNLVRSRIEDLRERRVDGYPPIGEFMARRLTPALDTCASIARRQEDLSGRIARNSQLLRTRVDVELERQNQELLAQMNRRAKIQLRLQETVEGLSVVAITYYASQLVQYLAKGLKGLIEPATPEIVTAASIPLIAGLVALGLRRMRRAVAAEEGGH